MSAVLASGARQTPSRFSAIFPEWKSRIDEFAGKRPGVTFTQDFAGRGRRGFDTRRRAVPDGRATVVLARGPAMVWNGSNSAASEIPKPAASFSMLTTLTLRSPRSMPPT